MERITVMKKMLVLTCLMGCFVAAEAAEIVVNSTGGGLGTAQLCSLRAAIRAAETDLPFSACPAGSGADTIILPAGQVLTFFEVDNSDSGNNALPQIKTTIVIEGNHATLLRLDSAPLMRFFSTGSNSTTAEFGHLTLKNMTLRNGLSNGSGGAIRNTATLVLDHVRLENNQASFEGGALSCSNGVANCSVKSSAFINNSANYAGAILVTLDGHLTLEDSLVLANQATIGNGAADGGSVYVESGSALIRNSTVANNQGGRYGGLLTGSGGPFTPAGSIELEYSTIVGNSPHGLVGNITAKNSILSANVGGNCRPASVITSSGYNHSDDDSCSFSQLGDVNSMPLSLAPLKVHSTYVQTMPLNYNSPAIDAADPADCVLIDQRGVARPLDGDNDGVFRCDKGAHEMVNNIIFMDSFESAP